MKKNSKETFKENILNPDSLFRKEAIKNWEEYIKYKEKRNSNKVIV